jgi:hypothetical protein
MVLNSKVRKGCKVKCASSTPIPDTFQVPVSEATSTNRSCVLQETFPATLSVLLGNIKSEQTTQAAHTGLSSN